MNVFSIHHNFARLAIAAGCLVIGTAEAAAQEVPDPNDPVGTTLVAAPNSFKSNQGPLPSVDAALSQAVENSPDVAAAKAKLALAEAELVSKRLEVSRQVLNHYSALNNFGTQSEALKAKLQAVTAMLDIEKQRYNAGVSADAQSEVIKRQAEIQELKSQLTQVAAQADAMGRELRMLLGSQPSAGDPRSPTSVTSPSAARRSQIPQGRVVEKIRAILDQTTDLGFADNPTPLKDVADYIAAKHNLPIYIHPSLDAAAILVDRTFKDVPLRYAFEGIQELTKGEVSFVVRDYGILVVPKDIAEQNDYASAIDFKAAPPARQPPAESVMSRGQSAAATGQPTTPRTTDAAPRFSRPNSEDPFGPPAKHSTDRAGGPTVKPSSATDPFGK